jgi:hypothetical protein
LTVITTSAAAAAAAEKEEEEEQQQQEQQQKNVDAYLNQIYISLRVNRKSIEKIR